MAYEVIKTIGGRKYRYAQTSKRVGGKVKTTSKYIGPVDGRKRKFKISWSATLMGGLALGLHIAKHGTKSPRYSNKVRESGRDKQAYDAKVRDLMRAYGLDPTNPDTFNRTYHALTPEQHKEFTDKHAALGHERNVARDKAHPVDEKAAADMKAFNERLQAAKAEQDARIAERQAAENAAPAKNFKVDDEIEARQAAHDKVVDEYNAGTQAAPATEAPADAPAPTDGAAEKA